MRRRLPALFTTPVVVLAGPARAALAARAASRVATCATGLAAAVLLAGCATPTVTRLHSLLPPQAVPAAAATPPLAIHLAQVVVPVAVDQAPWLVRLPDGSLLQLEQDRWASPLRDELRAALREILAQRWGAVDARGVPAAWRVAVEVTRFESIAGQEARLEAHWTAAAVVGSGARPTLPAASASAPGTAVARAPALSCRAVLREPVEAGSTAMAAGHQRAVGRLADRIGRQLRATAAGDAPACEADGT